MRLVVSLIFRSLMRTFRLLQLNVKQNKKQKSVWRTSDFNPAVETKKEADNELSPRETLREELGIPSTW